VVLRLGNSCRGHIVDVVWRRRFVLFWMVSGAMSRQKVLEMTHSVDQSLPLVIDICAVAPLDLAF
jgi:hypothetical protein